MHLRLFERLVYIDPTTTPNSTQTIWLTARQHPSVLLVPALTFCVFTAIGVWAVVVSSQQQKVTAQQLAQKYVANQADSLEVNLLRAYQPALMLSTFIQLVRVDQRLGMRRGEIVKARCRGLNLFFFVAVVFQFAGFLQVIVPASTVWLQQHAEVSLRSRTVAFALHIWVWFPWIDQKLGTNMRCCI